MDLRVDSGTLPAHTAVGSTAMEEELSLSNARCQTQGGGTILLQLLEFKTHLLETFEELHIRRDAEARFEDQISKLVLEKQELEWETESLQHQMEMLSNQHSESLVSVKKQLQANITNIEEEKGKYQISAELKDKEINNLKEKLKSLQLLKYNLEKRSNELGQKLTLQSRTKESHLNQMGEVEKRFSALSRQCAMVKQAHEKLEQNVEEALKIIKKLTAANEKQEATIASLTKELEEISHELIKAKMTSVRRDEARGAAGREQHCEQLHHQLNLETEMNKKLCEENVAVRAEKLELMSCLQHTQQLLLSQTQTVRRVEQQLHTLREQHQALKREQRAMRERSQAAEDEVARLMESDGASKHSWDKEKAVFLERIEGEQQQLRAVKEAHEELRREHAELSSQAKVHAQHICESQMSGGVPPEGIRWKGTLNEPVFGSLQHLASSHTHSPDRLEDMRVAAERDATGASGESTVLSYGHVSVDGSSGWMSLGQSDERTGGTGEREQSWKDDAGQVENDRDEGEGHQELQLNGERHDAKEGGSVGAQAADGVEEILGSGQEPERPETGTTGTCLVGEGGKTRWQAAETPLAAQTPAGRTTGQSAAQQVDDLPADCGAESDSSRPGERYETPSALCCSDRGPNRVVREGQSLRCDEVIPFAKSVTPIYLVREKTEADLSTKLSGPPNQSDVCSSQIDGASAAQSDGGSLPKSGTTQPQPGDPSDIRQTAAEPYELSGQLTSPWADDDGGTGALTDREGQSSVDARENENSEKDDCADAAMDTADLETGSSPEQMATNEMDDAGEAMTSTAGAQPSVRPRQQGDASLEAAAAESYDCSPAKETPDGGTNQSPLLGSSSAQRRAELSTDEAHASFLHPFVQRRVCTIPAFLKSKPDKVPFEVTRASALLGASGVSGSVASSPRRPGETAAADPESRASVSAASFPVSRLTRSRSGCSRDPNSAEGPESESDRESLCSQEREDQQSSFRAQISKIEQFLNTEKLRLPKRRRTDD
nr:uncharacterized protein LOC120809742 isoform X2 [Gasterosteus aculeatus aculeatus]